MPAHPPRHATTAWCLLLLAAGWRLAVLWKTDFAIDGDEGTVGLMALHIARLEEWPVWFYGQPYMGALEAYLAAPAMAVFGGSAVALKLVALVFAVTTVLLGWSLARRVLGERGGLVAGLYLAVPPMVLTVWSLKMRGGYTSLLAMGTGLLLLAHVIGTRGASLRNSAAFGLLAGLTTWLNLLVLPFLGAAGLYLLMRRRLARRLLVASSLAFLVGAAPLILANVASGGETVRFLADRTTGLGGDPTNAWLRHPGQLLGLGPPWGPFRSADISLAGWAVVLACGIGLAGLLLRARRGLADGLRGRPTTGVELLLLTAVLYQLCAVVSGFGSVASPRFAVVLYPVIAVVFGDLLGRAGGARGPLLRRASAAAVILLLSFNVHSTWRHFENRAPGYSGKPHGAYTHAGDVSGSLELLESLDVDGLAGDHWLRHIVAFRSDDRIAPSPPRYGPHAERFRRATTIAWSSSPDSPDDRWMAPLMAGLPAAGVDVEVHERDGQRFSVLRDAGLPAGDWTADSVNAPHKAQQAIDRDPRTAWAAFERPQDAVEPPRLTIDLGQRQPVEALGFLFARSRPRRLGILTSTDGLDWSPLRVFAPPANACRADLPPTSARFVRLLALSGDDMQWSLAELFVHGDDDG